MHNLERIRIDKRLISPPGCRTLHLYSSICHWSEMKTITGLTDDNNQNGNRSVWSENTGTKTVSDKFVPPSDSTLNPAFVWAKTHFDKHRQRDGSRMRAVSLAEESPTKIHVNSGKIPASTRLDNSNVQFEVQI